MSTLQTPILSTLAYYDTHDYPLSADEIWRWLWVADQGDQTARLATPAEVRSAVDDLVAAGQVERAKEFFVLPGRGALADERLARAEQNQKKWRRAVTVAKYLEIVPYVKMVAVANTLAINNASEDSDIDLFIVTAPGHIWIARLAVTAIVSMLGYRRSGGRRATRVKDKVCLSFYITTNAMNLDDLKSAAPDPHFMFWASQMVPLLDDGTYRKFVAANAWITGWLPHAWEWDWKRRLIPENPAWRSIKNLYGAFFNSPLGVWIENWARNRQLKRFDQDGQSKSRAATTDVVISEDVLKFHEADRRQEYNQRFRDRLRELGIVTAWSKG